MPTKSKAIDAKRKKVLELQLEKVDWKLDQAADAIRKLCRARRLIEDELGKLTNPSRRKRIK